MHRLNWLPPLLARITLGSVFMASGWYKFHNLQSIVEFFQSLGIPLPGVQAPFVAAVELGCGLLVLVGLKTRWAAFPLIGTMCVAIVTAKLGKMEKLSDLFELSEFLYSVLLLWLAAAGPGGISVDQLLPSQSKKKRK